MSDFFEAADRFCEPEAWLNRGPPGFDEERPARVLGVGRGMLDLWEDLARSLDREFMHWQTDEYLLAVPHYGANMGSVVGAAPFAAYTGIRLKM